MPSEIEVLLAKQKALVDYTFTICERINQITDRMLEEQESITKKLKEIEKTTNG